jgi:hypothetical protein
MTRFEVFAIVFCFGLFLLGFAFGMVTWYQFTSQPPYTNYTPLIVEFIALVPFSIGLIGLVYYKAFPKEKEKKLRK